MTVNPNTVISKLASRVANLEVEKAALEAAVDQLLAHECPGCDHTDGGGTQEPSE